MILGGLLKRLTPRSLVTDLLSRQVGILTERAQNLERQLAAELAENERLVDALAAEKTRAEKAAGDCACGGDTELYLRRQVVLWQDRAVRDRANANRMANQLAKREKRAVIGSLT